MKFLLTLLVGLFSAGCIAEHSYPLRPGDLHRLSPAENSASMTARPWLQRVHQLLKDRLPAGDQSALLTEDMVDAGGRPVNVYSHFQLNPKRLDSFLFNSSGMTCTARTDGPDFSGQRPKLAWSNYEEVWIPVRKNLSLHGQLGLATRGGHTLDADCIVILPGLLGHNDNLRSMDLANALRAAGVHALALELCGHGQTHARYPNVYYDYGILETEDLMVVSEWLQQYPHICRTGLIGFCWGGNQALLAAWYDSRAATHPSISSHIAARLRPVSPVGHFEAGVIAFSPVLRFEDIIESLETRHTAWRNPVLAHLQNTVYERMKFKGHPNPCGSLYQLIVSEVARSDLAYPRAVDDGLDFLRLMPHRGQPDGDKLAECRMPVLIVQSANDPLSPAQDLADFVARVDNHNVAGIILPGGGHVGFAAYARSYYFSLIGNFFDAQNAPKARDIPRLAKSSKSDPA